jgi:hypothetical protein
MQPAATDLYLDLMKKTLSFLLWEEPGVPVETFNYRRPWPTRAAVGTLARVLGSFGLRAMQGAGTARAEREDGVIWPMYAHTMIGLRRLDNIQDCVETVLREGVAGDLIEAGVWRGGATIFMRAILKAHDVTDRRVFVADSFAGLPPPDTACYPQDAGDKHHAIRILEVSRREVETNFERFGLLDSQVVFLQGWFEDTLPAAPIERLAVMRVDGDMYSSTTQALSALYPKLSSGGFCIVDDYALDGCQRAVDDFRAAQGIASPLEKIDWTGVFWRKA